MLTFKPFISYARFPPHPRRPMLQALQAWLMQGPPLTEGSEAARC